MAHTHYSETEEQDAKRVDDAEVMIKHGEVAEARVQLQDVVANCPELYAYNFGNEREQYIKFWSMAEYLGYISLTRNRGEQVEQEIIWLKSAYPRAYYLLAELDIADNNDGGAAEYLDQALRLEPDHPDCLLRMAEIYARSGDVEAALEHYEMTLASRPYLTTQTICHALGGKAQQLVELDRIEDAEDCLEESLKHSPDNKLAMNLQRYIEAAKTGNITPPVQIDGVESVQEDDTEPEPVPVSPETVEEEAHIEPPEAVAPPTEDRKWWKFWK